MEPYYVASAKGMDFVKKNYDYVLLHKHNLWRIDWHEYDQNHENGSTFYDTCWKIFNERLLKENLLASGETYLHMYQLLMEEKRYDYAIESLLRLIYFDVSGLLWLDDIKDYHEGVITFAQATESYYCEIAPALIEDLPKLKEFYKPEMIDMTYEWKLPIQICDKKLFKEIIESSIDGKYDADKIKKNSKKAYIAKLKQK